MWTTRQSRMLGTSDGAPATVGVIASPRRVRTQQPQSGGVGIDASHPLARGLVSALNPVTGVDGAANVAWTPASTISKTTRQAGVSYTATGSGRLTANRGLINNTDPFTVFFVASGATSTGMLLGGTTGFNNIGVNGSNWFAWAVAGGISGGASVVNRFDKIALKRTATGAEFFVNGSKSSGTWTGNVSGNTVLVNRGDNAVPFGGNMALALVWNRALSDAEIASLSANPYQIFAPDSKQIWGPA